MRTNEFSLITILLFHLKNKKNIHFMRGEEKEIEHREKMKRNEYVIKKM